MSHSLTSSTQTLFPGQRERERDARIPQRGSVLTTNRASAHLRRKAGFTLVELLIYVGVFSIAAGLFTGVLSTLTRVQVRESATVEVSGQAQFVIQTIQRLVTDASIIELASDTATSTLKLRMADASRDPTCIELSGGVVYLMEGNDGVNKQTCFATSSPQARALTDSKVVVNTLNFTKLSNPPAKDTVKIDLTVAYNSQNPQESLISRTLQTAITKISAATFDADVVPATDNIYTVGLGAQKWAKGFFSNLLVGGYSSVTGGVAAFNGNVGVGTSTPTGTFHVSNASSTSALVVATSGNVGIGTTDPSQAVHISSQTPTLLVDGNTDGSVGGPGMRVTRRDLAGAGANVDVRGKLNAAQTGIDLTLWTNGAERMRVLQSNGNVGIGTTSPKDQLQIGNRTTFRDSGASWSLFQNNLYFDGADYRNIATGGGSNILLGNAIQFRTAPSGAADAVASVSERVIIDSAGNVGIGTTNPGAKLEIQDGTYPTAPGRLRLSEPGGNALDLYVGVSTGTTDGNAACQRYKANATCLAYWSSGGTLSTCGTAQANGRALCAVFP